MDTTSRRSEVVQVSKTAYGLGPIELSAASVDPHQDGVGEAGLLHKGNRVLDVAVGLSALAGTVGDDEASGWYKVPGALEAILLDDAAKGVRSVLVSSGRLLSSNVRYGEDKRGVPLAFSQMQADEGRVTVRGTIIDRKLRQDPELYKTVAAVLFRTLLRDADPSSPLAVRSSRPSRVGRAVVSELLGARHYRGDTFPAQRNGSGAAGFYDGTVSSALELIDDWLSRRVTPVSSGK